MTEADNNPELSLLEKLRAIEAGNLARVGPKTHLRDIMGTTGNVFFGDMFARDVFVEGKFVETVYDDAFTYVTTLLEDFAPGSGIAKRIVWNDPAAAPFVTFRGHTNLIKAPLPSNTPHPDRLNLQIPGKDNPDIKLLQGTGVNVNTPGRVYASFTDDASTSWDFVVTSNYQGWVEARKLIPTTREELWYDPIHPTKTLEKLKARNSSLGFIRCAGALEVAADGIVTQLTEPYDKRFYPLNPDEDPAELTQYEKSNGYLPEGIQLLTLGNAVEIVGQTEDGMHSLVKLPGRDKAIQIPNEYLQMGFMEPTAANIQRLLAHAPQTYSWGDRMGVNVDCTGLFQRLYSMFGIALPRDTDQLLALKDMDANVEAVNILPSKAAHLSPKLLNRLLKREQGFILVVAKAHAMILSIVYSNGHFGYTHTVGVGRDPSDPGTGVHLWQTLTTPALFDHEGKPLSMVLSFQRLKTILGSDILMVPLLP